jgi:transcriptional regulator with XRE-family HTH domain
MIHPDKDLTPSDLGRLLRDRRTQDRISLRQAAEELGVSFNSLARIEKGHIPDVATFQRVAEWIGIAPSQFFGPGSQRSSSTPDAVAAHLKADPALSEDAAEQIASIVSQLYSALAQDTSTTAVHLRSARALRADAAVRLADLVVRMQHTLEREDAAG